MHTACTRELLAQQFFMYSRITRHVQFRHLFVLALALLARDLREYVRGLLSAHYGDARVGPHEQEARPAHQKSS